MPSPHASFALAAATLFAACAAAPSTEVAPAAEEPVATALRAEDTPECVLDGAGVFYVASHDATRPRVRYADGQVSLDDHCAIRVENRLNRRIPPVYVNGRPIGFC